MVDKTRGIHFKKVRHTPRHQHTRAKLFFWLIKVCDNLRGKNLLNPNADFGFKCECPGQDTAFCLFWIVFQDLDFVWQMKIGMIFEN